MNFDYFANLDIKRADDAKLQFTSKRRRINSLMTKKYAWLLRRQSKESKVKKKQTFIGVDSRTLESRISVKAHVI